MDESASCVAARNAVSLPSAGTAGAFGVPAGATRALHGARWSLGVVSLTADGFARNRQRNEAKATNRVRSSRSRCARVPRLVAEVYRRRSVQKAASGCGWRTRTGPSLRRLKNRRGRKSDRAPLSDGKRYRGAGKGPRRAPLWMEGVLGRESRSPSHWVAVEAISADSGGAGLRAL